MNAALLILRKELLEFLRDRRVLFGAVILPLMLVWLIMSMMSVFRGFLEKPSRSTIVVLHETNGHAVLSTKAMQEGFTITEVSSVAEGKKSIEEKQAKLFIDFRSNVGADMEQGRAVALDVYLNAKDIPSQIALSKLRDAISKVNKTRETKVLAAHSLTEKDIKPVTIHEISTTKKEEASGEIVFSLLPYMMVLFAFNGGMSQVGDAVAGEKERGTLETLLVSPARRTQIAIGKLLAMGTVCLASSLSAIVGLLLGGGKAASAGIHFSPVTVIAVLGTMLPLVIMFAAMLVAVSAYARNQKEASTYASAMLFVVIVPAVGSQFIGFTDLGQKAWIGLVPVLNSATVIRQALMGEINWTVFALTLVTSVFLATLALLATVRMFGRESVLFRV